MFCVSGWIGFAQEVEREAISPNQLGYSVTRWGIEEGLSTSVMRRGISQDPEGFIWMNTPHGMIRFDGVNFQNILLSETGLTDRKSLIEREVDREGRIWYRSVEKDLYLYEDNRLTDVTYSREDVPENIWKLFLSDAREPWLIPEGQRELLFLKDGRFHPHPLSQQLPDKIRDARVLEGETVWLILEDLPGLWRYNRDTASFETVFTEVPFVGFWRRYDGSLAAASLEGLYSLSDEGWSRFSPSHFSEIPNGGEVIRIVEDRFGNIWAATRREGLEVQLKNGRFGYIDYPSLNMVNFRSMVMSDSGEIWIGANSGLFRIRSVQFQNWVDVELVNKGVIQYIAPMPSRDLLFAAGSTIIRYDQSAEKYVEEFATQGMAISRLLALDNGDLLLGNIVGKVWRYRGDTLSELPFQVDTTKRLYQHSDSSIFVGSVKNLWKMIGDEVQRVIPTVESTPVHVQKMHSEPSGDLFVLGRNNGPFRFDGRNLVPLLDDVPKGLFFMDAFRLGPDEYLVGGGGAGLFHYKNGMLNSLGVRLDAQRKTVWAIKDDAAGNLWITTDVGYYCLERESLDRVLAGAKSYNKIAKYTYVDGLASSMGFQQSNSMYMSEEGDVWLCTRLGISHTNIFEKPPFEDLGETASTFITSVYLDSENTYPVTGTRIPDKVSLKPHQNSVDIQFSVLGLTRPEVVEFQCKLVGVDEDWRDLGTSRQVAYDYLPAGNYTFQVRAKANPHIATVQTASLAIVVLPYWYETLGFKLFLLIVFCLILYLVATTRIRRLRREHFRQVRRSRQLMKSQEQERTRIARELHDSIGQELLVIKGQVELAGMKNGGSEVVKDELEQLSEDVNSVVEHVRQISHGLRPPHLERFGLASTLKELCARVEESSGIPFETEVEDQKPRLDGEIEISIYRLVQEALANLVKHSDASSASVKLYRKEGYVTLEVEDDGRGFTPTDLDTNVGLGLSGMEERVAQLGGEIHLRSQPREGTHIRVDIPL